MDSVRSRIKALAGAALVTAALTGCAGSSDAHVGPGVTKEPCPNAVNKKNGCIYLGIISDLTSGPFKALGAPMTTAEQKFWHRVNQQGGIKGYDIDVVTYVRDNRYDIEVHRRAHNEIKGKVLALAQTLGSPMTDAILPDLRSNKMIAVPASWSSKWEAEDVILESGASYCFESMNAIDYIAQRTSIKKVLSVHYPGDYGADAAAGAQIGARAHGLTFSDIEVVQNQPGDAVDAIMTQKPDLVIVTTGPADAAAIVGDSVSRGFDGRFFGTNPTWDKSLLKNAAAPAMKSRYLQTAPWKPFATDSPGHTAMRAALGSVDPNDNFTSGWVSSYPLKAVLQKAAENKDLTRDGLLEAVKQTTIVDYEGMLPSAAGNFSGDANTSAFRQSVINRPDDAEFTGIKVISDFFSGPTARSHRFTGTCQLSK
ncbi:ABC transporter substrate-binding protein [Actinomadura rudentiformis]|uniref:ABC transporter substrate-binding protein n=1 Tax=Actinomadura rudentiformis TaxID=359158 RepID=A0A6H9YA36_9ACTN|nr:ABC transporter substrate-binding protein [Actinomadura rudentiformis]KAB2339667.1 ABC transporter substrate-binding protein [Actinomadura rudentiformis]